MNLFRIYLNNNYMEKAVIERLKLYLKNRSLKNRELASILNMSETTLNNKLNGNRGMDLDTLLNVIIHFEDLSVEWLLRGDGSMIKGEQQVTDEKSAEMEFVVCVDGEGYLRIKR